MRISVISDLPPGRSRRSSASARAWAPAAENIRAAAPRARSRFRATAACAALKAARCRCTAACPSAASPTFSAKNTAIVNLGRLNELEGDTFDPGKLLELGVVEEDCLNGRRRFSGTGELYTSAITVKARTMFLEVGRGRKTAEAGRRSGTAGKVEFNSGRRIACNVSQESI